MANAAVGAEPEGRGGLETFVGNRRIAERAARARAADEARKYLGLNTRGCACVPIASKSDGPSAAYRCRVSYEVLVRAGSN